MSAPVDDTHESKSAGRYEARHGDPPGLDPRPLRHVRPELWDFEAAYGRARIATRGAFVTVVVLAAILLGSIWYLGLRQESVLTAALASTAREHDNIVVSAQQTACILALSQQGKLEGFMQDYGPDAWARYCWWIRRGGKER